MSNFFQQQEKIRYIMFDYKNPSTEKSLENEITKRVNDYINACIDIYIEQINEATMFSIIAQYFKSRKIIMIRENQRLPAEIVFR